MHERKQGITIVVSLEDNRIYQMYPVHLTAHINGAQEQMKQFEDFELTLALLNKL